jgi:uncharacterized phage protein (TIGR01671 family)
VREILFRGKRKDDGEWVYGFYRSYIYRKKKHAWLETIDRTWEIKPETVGQFTGLTDKNGVRIFEGDIVRVDDIYKDKLGAPISLYYITYESGSYRLRMYPEYHGENEKDINWLSLPLYHFERNTEIIGNIHDTPELSGRK